MTTTIIIPNWAIISILIILFLDCLNTEKVKTFFKELKKNKLNKDMKRISCKLTFIVPKTVTKKEFKQWIYYSFNDITRNHLIKNKFMELEEEE